MSKAVWALRKRKKSFHVLRNVQHVKKGLQFLLLFMLVLSGIIIVQKLLNILPLFVTQTYSF